MNKIISIYFIILFSISSLFANSEKKFEEIALLSGSYLYNYDEEQLQNVLKSFMESNKEIVALQIYENVENKLFFSAFRDKDKITQSAVVPDNFNSFKKLKFPISYNDEPVGNGVVYYKNQIQTQLSLTKEEKKWLENHPVIKVHNELNWAPYNFNKNGYPVGLSIDYMNLLASIAGIKIDYISGEWNDLYNLALNKKIDVMLNLAKTKAREEFFLFTDKYQANKSGIFSHFSSKEVFNDLSELNGKKVVVVDGFFHGDYIAKTYPLIQLVYAKNIKESLTLLSKKEVDAAVGSFQALNYMIIDMSLSNKIKYDSDIFFNDYVEDELHIGIRKDFKELHSILSKAAAKVTPSQMYEIRKKWLLDPNVKSKIIFTKEELKWIKENPVVKVGGETDWAPFDFVDESGNYDGLAKDYLDFISEFTGLKFDIKTDT